MTALPATLVRNATRLRNMEARRHRILDEAGRLLAQGGDQALTVRGLADAARVTVPTIYNLIGGKEQVVAALVASALDALEAALDALPEARGIARAEAAVHSSATLFFADPARYGAVFRAVQDIQAEPTGGVLSPLFRRAGEVYCQSVREAQEDGDLHGRLRAVPLGHHILHAQMETFRLWALRALPESAIYARALYALYVTLMADATKQTRKRLLERVQASEATLDN